MAPLASPSPPLEERRARAVRPVVPVRGSLTLEQRLEAILDRTQAAGEATCPLCGERMTAAPDGARCRSCDTRLS